MFALATIGLLLLIGLGVYYLAPLERSVFVEATTERALVVMTQDEQWRLSDAVLCGPTPRGRASGEGMLEAGSICGNGSLLAEGRSTVEWPAGASLEVRRRGPGPAEVRLIAASERQPSAVIDGQKHELASGYRLILRENVVAALGAMPFVGRLVIGKGVSSGTNAVLRAGSYELRERLPFRPRPDITTQGALRPGDVVSIEDAAGEDVPVQGFLASPLAEETGLTVVGSAASSQRGLALSVARHGFAPTRIEPKWSDRALADQVTYALVVVMTVVLTFLSLAVHVRDLVAR